MEDFIGRVTRCSTRGFVGAMLTLEADQPVFGSLCGVTAQNDQSKVVGTVYDISIDDDPFARILASSADAGSELLADQSENRLIPVEFDVLSIGYIDASGIHHSLPPQPPLTMAPIHPLSTEEIRQFTAEPGYLALILSAVNIPVDDLIISTLRFAADARAEGERDEFFRQSGKECARVLGGDLVRLETILRTLKG